MAQFPFVLLHCLTLNGTLIRLTSFRGLRFAFCGIFDFWRGKATGTGLARVLS